MKIEVGRIQTWNKVCKRVIIGMEMEWKTWCCVKRMENWVGHISVNIGSLEMFLVVMLK